MIIWHPSVLVDDGLKEFYYTYFNNLPLQTLQQSQIDQWCSNTVWCKKMYYAYSFELNQTLKLGFILDGRYISQKRNTVIIHSLVFSP